MLERTISGFWVSTSAIQVEPTAFSFHATAWVIQVVLKLGTSNSRLMLPLASLVSIGCHNAVLTSFSRSTTFSRFFSLTLGCADTCSSSMAPSLIAEFSAILYIGLS